MSTMRLSHLLWLFMLWLNVDESLQQSELTCKLSLPATEGTSYDPPFRNVFSPGDTLRVMCGEKYWISRRQDTSAEITCRNNGKWSVTPTCNKLICLNPRDRHLRDWNTYWGQQITLGDTVRYSCKSGFKRTDGVTEATCTREGWKPDPLCQELRCSAPVIENGYVVGDIQVYKQHEFLEYKCNQHYKPTEERLPTCIKIGTRAEWSPTPACEQVTCKLSLPATEGTSYDPPFKNVFSPGDTLRVMCGEKYWISRRQDTSAEITCRNNGNWSVTPTCNKLICLNPRDRHLRDWNTYWGQQITLGDTVRYSCKSGFKRTDGVTEATCTREGWKPDPLCQEVTCNRKHYQNAEIIGRTKSLYKYNEQVEYACKDGYEGRFSITCGQNGWIGSPQCREVTCNRKHYQNAEIIGRTKSLYKYNEQVEYVCKNGYEGRFSVTCGQDGWIGSLQCREPVGCASPPPLADGDIKDTMKSQYSHKEQVEYVCQSYYTMEGEPYKTCIDGAWTGHIRCLQPCIVDEDNMRQHNITLKSTDNKYFAHDEVIEFRCARGVPIGSVPLRQRCNGGVILIPTCQ